VQKSYGRLFLLDARRRHRQVVHEDNGDEKKCEAETTTTTATTSSSSSSNGKPDDMLLAEWLEKPIEETYNDPKLDNVLKQLSKEAFEKRLGDANAASKIVGNTYTASVFLGLASLVDRCLGDESSSSSDTKKSIAVFSYGSGALATLYRLETYVPLHLCHY
jgi:3-hydroxy-3-methylglutaryl CoA synthase